jgi:hypothetical protein
MTVLWFGNQAHLNRLLPTLTRHEPSQSCTTRVVERKEPLIARCTEAQKKHYEDPSLSKSCPLGEKGGAGLLERDAFGAGQTQEYQQSCSSLSLQMMMRPNKLSY